MSEEGLYIAPEETRYVKAQLDRAGLLPIVDYKVRRMAYGGVDIQAITPRADRILTEIGLTLEP